MTPRRLVAPLAALALVLTAAAYAATAKITASGAGKLKLGMTYREARAQGLVGKIHPGCELGGPGTRSAQLRAPLRGSVDFSLTSPRKVAFIAVTRGGAARGVGIGATKADIRAAFPKVKFDHSTESTFEYTAARVPKRGGGPLEFAVSTRTHRVEVIGIPGIAACE